MILMQPSRGWAEEMGPGIPEIRSRPLGTQVELEGVPHRCFDLDEYKAIGHIWIDYLDLHKNAVFMLAQNRSLQLELELSGQRIKLWQDQAGREKDRGDLLKVAYDEEHKKLAAWQKQSRAMAWIPWVIVVAESLVIGAVGVWAATEGYKEN